MYLSRRFDVDVVLCCRVVSYDVVWCLVLLFLFCVLSSRIELCNVMWCCAVLHCVVLRCIAFSCKVLCCVVTCCCDVMCCVVL